MDARRRYTVVGVGAIGGWYGSRLARAGFEVRWVARSEADHLRAHGLRVSHAGGEEHFDDLTVLTPDEVAGLEAGADPDPNPDPNPGSDRDPVTDVVLVCTKTTADVDAVVARLVGRAAVGPSATPIVVAMQNGLGVEARLAAAAPGATVLGAMCFICSNRVGPGHIRHLDYGRVTLGEWTADGRAAGVTDAVHRVAADLRSGGIEVVEVDDLAQGRWSKLVWNIPYNGLSVVLDAGTDELMAQAATRHLVRALMDEVVGAAAACGHPVPEGFADKMMADTDRMEPYATSMKLDHDDGRPLELSAIYDAPLAAARTAGFTMPRTEMLAAQLHFLDQRVRPR